MVNSPTNKNNAISSEAIKHLMRTLDTILKLPKVMLLVTESHWKILFISGNNWPASVGLILDQNVSKCAD